MIPASQQMLLDEGEHSHERQIMHDIHTRTAGTTDCPRMATPHHVTRRLSRWWQSLQQRRRIRQTERMLQSLSDHTLKDIGIDRSEAGPVARRQRS
jgi:uncharacterized protein YjiS (DUF1127 family)